MDKDVFAMDELLQKSALSKETLADWIKWKLVRPVGFTEDQAPLFSDESLDRAADIQKLTDLGYALEDIQKILKKVGFPGKKTGKKETLERERYLTVGNLAVRSGVSPRTIKHWEEKGIIEPDMRTEGGFRLYSETFVLFCKLIQDLQLFGYTLEEIKAFSDSVRTFLTFQADLNSLPKSAVEAKLESMLKEIQELFDKMKLFKEGIARWEDLLKKGKKDIQSLKKKNQKRTVRTKGDADA